MQTALYDKIKERRSEWLTGANTQNVPYLSIVATQEKTKVRKTSIDKGSGALIVDKARKRVRRVLMMAKAPRRQGVQFTRVVALC